MKETMKAHVSSDARGRKETADPCLEPCPIEKGMRVLGGKRGLSFGTCKTDPRGLMTLPAWSAGQAKR